MSFLPIVERELRMAARRKSTYRIRTWTAALAMAVAICSLALVWLGGSRHGDALFSILAIYSFGLCLLAGAFLTADCLSEEKRQGTLGLLFLTDLKGYDIVLGKFIASSLNAVYGLVALLPIIAMPLLLGGVTPAEFWRMAAALLNALFFSLAAGIFISALARETEYAMGGTFGVLLLLAGALPALAALAPLARLPARLSYLAWVSPFYPFACAREAAYLGQATKFWGTLISSHGLGWLLIGLASWGLPRFWSERVSQSDRLSWRRRFVRLRGEAPSQRARLRERLLAINPVLWLVSRRIVVPRAPWLFVLVWGATVALATAFVPTANSFPSGFLFSRYIEAPFAFLLKVLFAVETCRFFSDARRSGALELLLCTPLSSRDIIRGQSLAMRRSFLWPVAVFLGLLLVPLGAQVLVMLRTLDFQNIIGLLLGAVSSVLTALRTIADLLAIFWLGLWLSLSIKKPNLAPGLTILFVLVLPAILSPCYLDMGVDLFLIIWAIAQLHQEMRWVLSRQYQEPLTRPVRVLQPRA